MTLLDHMSEPVKRAADAAAVFAPVGIFLNLLPTIAAVLSVIWLALRIATSMQEYRINRRKEIAQTTAVKSYREELNETVKEGIPPDLQRLLNKLK